MKFNPTLAGWYAELSAIVSTIESLKYDMEEDEKAMDKENLTKLINNLRRSIDYVNDAKSCIKLEYINQSKGVKNEQSK